MGKNRQEKTLFGFDISATRADDLDKKMIAYASKLVSLRVLDVACGAGGQSLRFVNAGAQVVAVDDFDYVDIFSLLREENNVTEESLVFKQGRMESLSDLLRGQEFDICCLQRAIHYVPYGVAVIVLKFLRTVIKDKLYISVTGIGSEIGATYADKNKLVAERFCKLDMPAAQAFNIYEPLCLYTESEFKHLLEESGWKVKEIWVSAFGNIKAICI